MQYGLTEEQIMLRDTVRRLAVDQILPGAAARDEKEEFAWDAVEVFRENGLFACDFKEEYGGAQMGMLAFCLAVEEVAKVCASSSVILLVHELGAMPMMLAGNDEQKAKWFPGLASGEHLVAFGLTEPGAGSDVAGLRTRAVKKGDKYIINGTKQFISHADVAQYVCIAAVTDPDKAPHKGAQSIIVVEKGTPGFSIGKKEHKMGIHGSTTCELILEDCEVPAANLLGSEGDGFHILMKTLDFTRPCVAAQALGIAQGALDYAVNYAKERVQFGRAIIKNQGLQWMLADMDTQVEAVRQLVYKTCAVFEQVPKDLSRVPVEAMRLSAMAKLLAGDTAMKVTTDAVQVLGGYGYVKEYPVERMMRDAKITQIYEGTSQVQKMVIGGLL
ncbi:MAG: acyl-CoA dehydrogenase family protein [Desulfarculaceae bacterium]|nr:acyl-CoA dehydrogenase family protein [Desulfarculaceae bacterium]MCF8049332.1 acyl-CoA dehydrogenase family protein [Desulfarculaceae bacterium]MCF8065679.1 acyl-CoA dehydrogenase family protein [Desulfarculaceae bacterium]MCF8124150.1 acyl-CoA dehydrogenase family protein [Desulfarculaceae bacterium]